jgi:hypothetical protein
VRNEARPRLALARNKVERREAGDDSGVLAVRHSREKGGAARERWRGAREVAVAVEREEAPLAHGAQLAYRVVRIRERALGVRDVAREIEAAASHDDDIRVAFYDLAPAALLALLARCVEHAATARERDLVGDPVTTVEGRREPLEKEETGACRGDGNSRFDLG